MPVYKMEAIQRTWIEVEVEGESPDKAWKNFLHNMSVGSVVIDDGETPSDADETVMRYADVPQEYDWLNCRELTESEEE